MTRAYVASFVVLLVTIALCFVFGELAFRLIDGYRIDRVTLTVLRKHDTRSGIEHFEYSRHIKLDPSFDTSWFATDPANYDRSNNFRLPPDWIKAVDEYKPQPNEPSFIKGELKLLYNYDWLLTACKTGEPENIVRILEHFKKIPGYAYAFASPDGSSTPQYRVVPRGWNDGFDSYNNFGFRGPDITPRKSSRTIRLAFLGASTAAQGWPFTYPEYATHFLRLWARSTGLNVDFDLVNAGRVGLNSSDVVNILRYEVAPLHPDIVVYDGGTGANDFSIRQNVKSSNQSEQASDLEPPKLDTLPLEQFSALTRRMNELLFQLLGASMEPKKPSHRLTFDFSQQPNISAPNLPLKLNRQISDIRQIGAITARVDGHLFITSSIDLVHAGLRLDPERDRFIIDQLNKYWPLTYAELREGFNFENSAYGELARTDHYSFLDVARYFPQDPRLFSDMYHFRGEDGERLQGWILAQMLAPYVKSKIERHQLPRPAYTPSQRSIAWATAQPVKFGLSCLP